MSGPALNPLANIATKATDLPRDGSTAGADVADTGFSRELQRQIDRDTKPSDTETSSASASSGTASSGKATGAPPASSGKTTDGKDADGPTGTKDSAQTTDTQAPSPDIAALLGSLLPAGANASLARQSDDTSQTPLTSLSTEAQPASDVALAALLAAGQASAASINTVVLAGRQDAASTKEATQGRAGELGSADTNGLDLFDSGASRRTLAEMHQSQSPLEAELTDATAKLAASGDAAGKLPDLGSESTPTNNFAAIHATALANLRGESATPAPSPVPLHVATPAGSPGWPEEVGSRVTWMVGHEESHAQLTLTPPQLGKIEVSITVSGDQTSAQFVAATPAARELIEQSLPRLREVLEQSGINLGQTDVGTSSQSNESSDDRRNGAWGSPRSTDEGATSRVNATQWIRRGDGLVDTFA